MFTFASDIMNASSQVSTVPVHPLDTPICYVNQDDSYYSSGAAGVIAKTRLTCEVGHSQTYSLVTPEILQCTHQVSAGIGINNPLSKYGCSVAAYENYANVVVAGGTTVTRYVPNTTMNSASPHING